MATLPDAPRITPAGVRFYFYLVMAFVMALTIVAGFSLNLAMGRSTFNAPWYVHTHAILSMGWIGLYLAQHITVATGNFALHARLGKLAYLWVPAIMVAGTAVMAGLIRANGGPFFFHKAEFLISNSMMLWCFGGLTLWALTRRRYTGWHRRLMLCGMAILTGPGIGRLLPAPLLIPNAWQIIFALTLIWPMIGMAADVRRDGRVHPAYLWGTGIIVGTFMLSMLFAYSDAGMAFTQEFVAGTPGAERPMEPFLPPGFAM